MYFSRSRRTLALVAMTCAFVSLAPFPALAATESAPTTDALPTEAPATEGSADGEEFSLEPYSDRIWGLATFYENQDNTIVQKFAFVGRVDVDLPLFDGNRGDCDDPQLRRLRFGLKASVFSDFTLHSEVDIDAECNDGESCGGDRYQGLADAYISWTPDARFHLKVGKVATPFTLDGSTSGKRLLTLERNTVAQNMWFPLEYQSGAIVSGRIQNTRYRFGAFSSATDKEFGDFDEVFGGLNWFLYGHQFKIQTGFKYTWMKSDRDYNG